MVRIVDEVLINLGVDPRKFKSGLADAAGAGNRFVASLQAQSGKLASLSIVSGIGFAAQARFIKSVTKAASDQELVLAKLESNLKLEQRTRADSIEALTKQANALQKVTQFADDQTISAQALLAGFGLTDDQILKLIPSVQDLAVNLQKAGDDTATLETVALAMGKAISTGSAGALGRYGVALNLAKGETVTFAKVLDRLTTSSFAGLAVAAGDTAAGRLKIFENAVGDVKEEIGNALLPVIEELLKKILPLIQRFGEWAASNKTLLQWIVGGGLAGAGLVAGLGSLGLMLAQLPVLLSLATGPMGALTLGFLALAGAIALVVTTGDNIAGNLEGVQRQIEKAEGKAASFTEEIKKLRQFTDDAGGGLTAMQQQRLTLAEQELAETVKWLAKLREAETTMKAIADAKAGALAGAGGGGGGSITTGASALSLDAMGIQAAGPMDREGDAMVSLFRAREAVLEGYRATVEETNEAIATSERSLLAEQIAANEEHAQMIAQKTKGVALAWGDMFAQVLETENNFLAAFGKSMVLTLVKVFGAVIRESMAEVVADKVKELAKAAIRAPLSFGASLAAAGPIIAAASAGIGLLGAMEGRLAKSLGGFETGGVIPATGHFLMHEGEVVYNPRRNTTAQLADNLARAGATREAAALSGGGGVNMPVNFWGDIRSQADVLTAMKQVERRWQRALGTAA